MKKLCLIFIALFFSAQVFADITLEPLLNTVTLSLHAEQWVTTKSALVDVGVNAAVADQGIEKLQAEIMQKLAQFSSTAEWHIVSFNRQQDQSGLESIQIQAQARLLQSELGNLRDKAKAISKPGETFTIDNVQFIPSDEEIKLAEDQLRNNIYQQVKVEIDVLNKQYSDQRFYVHHIDFIFQPVMPMAMKSNEFAARVASPPLSVGNKQSLQARVVLAAMPEIVAQKLAH